MEWTHKDLWHMRGDGFTVEVSRHESYPDERAGKDIHRWAVYAYIYPAHPHFAAFDPSGGMFQRAAQEMPFHGGPIGNASYFHVHRIDKMDRSVITSFQVGADYDHLHDEHFTWYADKEAAWEVFRDAERLVEWLENFNEAQVPASPEASFHSKVGVGVRSETDSA